MSKEEVRAAVMAAAKHELERTQVREAQGSYLRFGDHMVVQQLNTHVDEVFRMARQYLSQLPHQSFYQKDHIKALLDDLSTIMHENTVAYWLSLMADRDDSLYERFSSEQIQSILAKKRVEQHYFLSTQKHILQIHHASLPPTVEQGDLIDLCIDQIKQSVSTKNNIDLVHHAAWQCLYIQAMLQNNLDWVMAWHLDGQADFNRHPQSLEGFGTPPKINAMPQALTDRLRDIRYQQVSESILSFWRED